MKQSIFFLVTLILLSQSVTSMHHTRPRSFATLSSDQKDLLSACIGQKAAQQEHRALHQNVMQELKHTCDIRVAICKNRKKAESSGFDKVMQEFKAKILHKNVIEELNNICEVSKISMPEFIEDGCKDHNLNLYVQVLKKSQDVMNEMKIQQPLNVLLANEEGNEFKKYYSSLVAKLVFMFIDLSRDGLKDFCWCFYADDSWECEKHERNRIKKIILKALADGNTQFLDENPCHHFMRKYAYLGLYKEFANEQLFGNSEMLKHLELVKFFIEIGADLNIKNKLDSTPLFTAIITDNLDGACSLIRLGANVNLKCDGKTPLHWAVCKHNRHAVQLLLNANADISLKDDRYGFTPLDIAKLYSDNVANEIIDLLTQKEISSKNFKQLSH